MSAWRVGRDSNPGLFLSQPSGQFRSFVDRVTKWIPGDVIVLYGASIVLLRSQTPDPNPSVVLLIAGAAAAFVFVLLGAWSTGAGLNWRRLFVDAVLAAVAFLIWSASIPDSGWWAWEAVSDNPGWLAVIAAALGVAFGLFAEGVSRRIP